MTRIKKISLSTLTLLALSFVLAKGLTFLNHSYPHLFLSKTTYAKLPAWNNDDPTLALHAFQRSCAEILKRKPDDLFSKHMAGGAVRDWQSICVAANQLTSNDAKAARQFFETWFEPYQIRNNLNSHGLFTGYYLPLLQGSLKPDKRFSIPIYGVPNDLITVQLGTFHQDLTGKTLIAQLKNNKLYKYPDRNAINQGAIQKNAQVLVWTDNLLDVFFAQIQGSAMVELPNHERFIINYAATNGLPYTAIGKILIENKAITKENMSMQTLRAWLEKHPDEINAILNSNASYVFFKVLKNSDPLGSEKIPLLPERSLAVDTRFIPLGAPLWLNTTLPTNTSNTPAAFQRLVIAQDTGGAIKGIIRGDVYWGASDKAADIAGHMQSDGQYWILLPKRKSS
jgi:membrane-bound lytic murein transglycosylase A